ncbi:MAG: hypothetical protein EBU31_18615 [Proteobacteria bacterium]|nr:hypothetical protein [Pseudomonadota bacterium]
MVVSMGSDGTVGSAELNCASPRSAYRLWAQVEADCAPPCGASTESCFAPHAGTSCSDPECCAQVCAALPACCDTGWDMTCVQEAADLCEVPPPANDACAGAIAATIGDNAFSLFGATLDPVADVPCRINSTATGSDVWFAWSPEAAGAYKLSVCGVEFDSRLAVYQGTCGNLSLIACNDNSAACQPNTNGSQTTASVTCGTPYLVRVRGLRRCGADPARVGPLPLSARRVMRRRACRH